MLNFLIFLSFSFLSHGTQLPSPIEIPRSVHKKTKEEIKDLFLSLKNQHKSPQDLLRLSYEQALLLREKDPRFFCLEMKSLSENKEFPLKDLALLKRIESCKFKEKLLFKEVKLPSFLDKHLAYSFFERSKKFDEVENLEALLFLSRKTSYRKDKLYYLNYGLNKAKKGKSKTRSLFQKALYEGFSKSQS